MGFGLVCATMGSIIVADLKFWISTFFETHGDVCFAFVCLLRLPVKKSEQSPTDPTESILH